MIDNSNTNRHEALQLTVNIVAAHISSNRVESRELLQLIESVYAALCTTDAAPQVAPRPEPAVPVKKSVFPDHIVCLEDGKPLKMLKRHLMAAYRMTPEQYRERWGLPLSYPMVAPDYATKRRDLARKIGLGTTRTRLVASA